MVKLRNAVHKSSSFKLRLVLALGISVIADALDYLAAPIFGVPIIGDVFDAIVITILYSITKSKISVVMNLAEFIPFIGDFLPVFTVSTLFWALSEARGLSLHHRKSKLTRH